MPVCSGNKLSSVLRAACDGVKHRLWIASPYIGGWQSVRSILGRCWWDTENIDVRLLTDEEETLNGDTLRRIAQKGPIQHLRGLHVKIYIIDDKVLLTSANLTGTAFSKRYEAGIMLKGSAAQSAIALYKNWWDSLARPFDSMKLFNLSSKRGGQTGEEADDPLPVLTSLPRDPGDFGDHRLVNLFLDYPRFLDNYKTLTQEYVSVQRIWPKVPTYFEVDGFLNFLLRDCESRPSKPFEKQPPRKLLPAQRKSEIRRLAKEFKLWADQNDTDGHWRLEHSKLVRSLLSRTRIRKLRKAGIQAVVEGLNCMNRTRQRNRFLRSQKNSTVTVKKALSNLLYGAQPLTERMSICAESLFSFKRSSVQELLGFYAPEIYPIRNATVNAGLRFFGFDISPH